MFGALAAPVELLNCWGLKPRLGVELLFVDLFRQFWQFNISTFNN